MAAETSTSSSSSSSHDYEVFLSFRGLDTRANFTDHLYHALQDRASIRTFRDSEELKYGEEIGKLLRAIEQSRISIPVFSENYASSTWCLKEIAKIMERKENHGQIVLPIFYKVNPSHVRNQTGSFEKAFLEHKKKQPKETVDSWRKALRAAGNLKGWDTQDPQYRSSEVNLINSVVGKILSVLNKTTTLHVAKHPVGIDTHVQLVLKLLDLQSEAVIFVGIHGMGGIGKTTIAKAVCNRIFHQFHGWCFLAEVRERASKWDGLVELQNKLVHGIFKGIEVSISNNDAGIDVIKQRCCHKKVLIILDDVDQDKQLDALAGGHNWFGSGSRILITTRDEHILNVNHVDKNKIYKPKELDDDLSLQLFSNHAFGRDQPPQDFHELSKEVAKVASGLPLALVLLGSFLRDKTRLTDWRSALQRLNKSPEDDIQKILEVSYDGLKDDDKEIFLDIACFFIGMDEETVIHILEDYCPTIGIKVLVLKSLVKIDDENKLTMHDLLRDMGREIVRKQCIKNPGERSRLWLHEEALDVLKKGKGTSKVEGLLLDFGYKSKDHRSRTEAFEAMSELRLLQINHAYLDGNYRFPIGLKWLRLRGLPMERIRTISHLEKLVVLDMSKSNITKDWNGWQYIQLIKTLKVLDLSDCYHLTRTANFSNNGSLERLILDGCIELVALHESIGHLKKLVFLSLRGCVSLKELPDSICELNSVKSLIVTRTGIEELPDDFGLLSRLERLSADNCHKLVKLPLSMGKLSSIKSLTLRGCMNLEKLPKAMGTMRSLTELYIDGTAIEELPDAIGSLEKLETLSARYCRKLIKLPLSMGKMGLLHHFDVRGSGGVELPRDFGMLSSLVTLDMSGCKEFKGFPENFGNLAGLSYLDASSCNLSEDAFPTDFGRLSSLKSLILSFNKFCSLPASIICLSRLQTVYLECCEELQSLPDLPFSLIKLNVRGCFSMERLPYLSNLKSLQDLCLDQCVKLSEIEGITHLPLLQQLMLQHCTTLQSLPELPSSLIKLNAKGCVSMERLPNLSNLKNLEDLCLNDCNKLSEIEGITHLPLLRQLALQNCRTLQSLPELPSSLIKLNAEGCISMERLPNLSTLKSLQDLCLNECEKLSEIEGITHLPLLQQLALRNCRTLQSLPKLPSSLIKLNANGCVSMERLPNLSTLKNLEDLWLKDCKKLSEIEGITHLPMLQKLALQNCRKLSEIEGITHLPLLQKLALQNCRTLQSLPELPSSLIELNAEGCVSMKRLPNLSTLKSLQDLCLNECEKLSKIEGITHLPLLQQLALRNCRTLQSLPGLPSSLIELNANGCVSMKRLPNLSTLKNLEDLWLNDCKKLSKIEGITHLPLLQQLALQNCRTLQSLPDLPSSLIKLNAMGCVSMERLPNLSNLKSLQDLCLIECEKLPKIEGITGLSLLWQLRLGNCRALQSLPDLPSGLKELDARGCISMESLPNLSTLKNLKVLCLNECEKLAKIEGITDLPLLQRLHLENCKALQALPELPPSLIELNTSCSSAMFLNLIKLKNLQVLGLCNCNKLSEIPGINDISLLKELCFHNCPRLQSLPEPPTDLKDLCLEKVAMLEGITGLTVRDKLDFTDYRNLVCSMFRPSFPMLTVWNHITMERLPDLSNFKKLIHLELLQCKNLSEIQSISGLSQLQKLHLGDCGKIHSLPKLPSSLIILYVQRCGSMERLEVSNLENLEKLNLECCDNLAEIRGLESLEFLKDLRMSGCHTCTKNFQKSVAQGMLPCSFDRRVIEPDFRQRFNIADDDNSNGTVLYFVVEYEILEPESPSPIDQNVISIAAVIRRNDAKIIECFHELKVEGMMAKTNVDQFYSCCFHGLTWFGFPLKDGDQVEVTGLCFLTEEDIRTNDESNFTNMLDEASFRGVVLKMFDFVTEHEAPEDSQQLENRVVHLINSMCVDDQGSISGLEPSERPHDGAGRSTCLECCNIC